MATEITAAATQRTARIAVRVIGRAPLKDPVEIKLRGYNLTLRNNEADHITVEVEDQ